MAATAWSLLLLPDYDDDDNSCMIYEWSNIVNYTQYLFEFVVILATKLNATTKHNSCDCGYNEHEQFQFI